MKLACNVPEERSFRDVWSHAGLQEALLNEVGSTLSLSEIGRILRAKELRPHRMKVWLHSPDPDFAAKVDVVTNEHNDVNHHNHIIRHNVNNDLDDNGNGTISYRDFS